MHTPRTIEFKRIIAALLFLTLCGASPAAAQERETGAQAEAPRVASPEVVRGRQLLEQGDAEGAVKALRPAAEGDKTDGEAWHLLGSAYRKLGKDKEAFESFRQAVAARLSGLRLARVPNAERFVLMTEAQRAASKESALKIYGAALESVEAYLQLNPKDADFWRGQAAAIKSHMEHVRDGEKEYGSAGPSSKAVKLVIHAKPDPGYTEQARRNGTGGRVTLRLIFGADGQIKDPVAIRLLPDGLTEKALEAARRIRFQPATVDGRPVSQFLTVEYGFDIDRRPIPRLP